jgi:hypothetical protein
MRTVFKLVPIGVFFLFFIACSSSKEQKPVTDKVEIKQVENGSTDMGFISGTVTEILPGKDGYTAQIITTAGEVFLVTISRANLTDPLTYRPVKVGEIISIKGDKFQMENQYYITVRELK